MERSVSQSTMTMMTGVQLKSWLLSQGLVPVMKARCTWPEIVADGLVLCQVANRLKPGVVQAQQMNYKVEDKAARRENVSSFLSACEKLGITPLFKEKDLLEEDDLRAVLLTLSHLVQKISGVQGRPGSTANVFIPGSFKRYTQSVSVTSSQALEAGAVDEMSMSEDMMETRLRRAKMATVVRSFVATQADELTCHKGDEVQVFEVMQSGWCDCSINGRMGFIPRKHLQLSDQDSESFISVTSSVISMISTEENIESFFSAVVQHTVASEACHVQDLQEFVRACIHPLNRADVLSSEEVDVLCGNYEELLTFHEKFLNELQKAERQPEADRQLGQSFCHFAGEMRQLSAKYCSNHPKAVALLTNCSEQLSAFMEKHGCSFRQLTTGLSQPFSRLAKYPALLTELARHTPENHKDRPKVLEAIPVYEELLDYVHRTRKHKECELDMINGTIEDWTGHPIKDLGDCQLMSIVREEVSEDTICERYLLLFPGYLTALVAADSMNGFKLLFKCPLAEAGLQQVDNPPNGIHIIAESHKLVASVSSSEDRELLLATWEKCSQMPANINVTPKPPTSLRIRHSHSGETLAPNSPTPLPQRHFTVGAATAGLPVRRCHMKLPLTPTASTGNLLSSPGSGRSHGLANGSARNLAADPMQVTRARRWSFRSMRPPPPVRPGLSAQVSGKDELRNSPVLIRKIRAQPLKRTRHRSKGEEDSLGLVINRGPGGKQIEDDSILKVIEAYCVSNQAKQHMTSTFGQVPVDLTAEEKESLMLAFRSMELKIGNMEKDAQEMRLATQETRAAQQEMQAALQDTNQLVKSLYQAFQQFIPTHPSTEENGVVKRPITPH